MPKVFITHTNDISPEQAMEAGIKALKVKKAIRGHAPDRFPMNKESSHLITLSDIHIQLTIGPYDMGGWGFDMMKRDQAEIIQIARK